MLTEINGNIDATYPIITGELTGYLGPIGTVTASADNSVGTPHVIVTQTPTPDGLDIDFAFKEMGIPGLDLTVEQDLTEEQQQTARENIDAQEVLTFDAAPTQGSQNPVTSGGVYSSVADINAKIPAAASAQNKLADKEYVDDSINRTSAFFRGNFATYADLMAVAWQTTDPDAANYVSNNDYAFVAADETHSGESWRYIYVLEEGGQDNGWAAQYRVNESPLTPEQLAALNSGITSQGVSQIETNRQGLASHVSNTSNPHQVTKAQVGLGNVDNTSDANKPISTAQQAALDAKQDAISSTASVNSDKTPYLYRRAGGGVTIGNRAYSKLIGATIANNQLIQNGNFESTSGWETYDATYAFISGVANNTISVTINSVPSPSYYALLRRPINEQTAIVGHKYLAMIDALSPTTINFKISPNVGDAGMDYLSVASNVWKTLGVIVPASRAMMYLSVYPYGENLAANQIYKYRNAQLFDLTAMFGSTIADYAYTLEQGQAGAGIAWLKSYGFFSKYAPYDAGSLISTKAEKKKVVGKNLIGQATLINATNAIWGGTTTTTPDGSFVLPAGTYTFSVSNTSGETMSGLYVYDTSERVAVAYNATKVTFTLTEQKVILAYIYKTGVTADILAGYKAQIELSSTPTTYEEYTSQEYDLGSDELRGLFKLDANNNIYADGDIKTSDGNITRKYGIVDLGTLTWSLIGDTRVYVTLTTPSTNTGANTPNNAICSNFVAHDGRVVSSGLSVGEFTISITSGSEVIFSSEAFRNKTAAEVKALMSGQYLVYELATPTTEQGTPYQNPQEVFADGTEEYIDTRTVPVPVGHQTDYPGITYLVSKLGSETAFSPFASDVPPAPTSDGTYVLQVSVSSGTPFYRWVSAAELVGE